jgi:hypothetical protein
MRIRRWVAAIALLGLGLMALQGRAAESSLGVNGGIRLLLHVEEADLPPGGIPTADPCARPPAIASVEDMVVEYDGPADTLMAWAYLYHPRGFAVRGMGFGILWDGIDVITSGSCAPQVFQDPDKMGAWAESGSEITFAWGLHVYPEGDLLPVAWFILAREKADAYFEVFSGNTPMAGAVADTNSPPRADPFWEYGRIGFGNMAGNLPIVDAASVPGAWGAVTIETQ